MCPHDVTVRETLRLFIVNDNITVRVGTTRGRSSRQHVLKTMEFWLAATPQLVRIYGATAGRNRPHLIEDPHCWCGLSVDGLRRLLGHQLAMFLPNDKQSFPSFLITEQVSTSRILDTMGVDIHALKSPTMLERSRAVKGVWGCFTAALSVNAPSITGQSPPSTGQSRRWAHS